MPPMSEQAPLNRPRSKTDLFISFTLLALQGFGGVLAVVQRLGDSGQGQLQWLDTDNAGHA